MGGEVTNGGTRPKKQLVINAFVETCSGHQSPGLWRHPDDESWKFNDIRHWVELAQLLEKGKFHGMFIADVLVSPSQAHLCLMRPDRKLTPEPGRIRCVQGA